MYGFYQVFNLLSLMRSSRGYPKRVWWLPFTYADEEVDVPLLMRLLSQCIPKGGYNRLSSINKTRNKLTLSEYTKEQVNLRFDRKSCIKLFLLIYYIVSDHARQLKHIKCPTEQRPRAIGRPRFSQPIIAVI